MKALTNMLSRWIAPAMLVLGLAAAPAASATVVSTQFSTLGQHRFVVPAGVRSVKAVLVGGSGGSAYNVFSVYVVPGGDGGVAAATVAVTPGQVLFAQVAGNGLSGSANGGGGGAPGAGHAGQRAGAGGGGGASVLRRCSIAPASPRYCGTGKVLSSRILVAGGGGGAGGDSDTPSQHGGEGGSAGAPAGGGLADGQGDDPGQGGQPGDQSAGGQAGDISEPTALPTDGRLGVGGNGGGQWAGGGGGGGAGLYGGGGGGGGQAAGAHGAGGGGGGGSSGVPAGTSGVSGLSTLVSSPGTPPSVMLIWTLPAPTVFTRAAARISSQAATLRGVGNPNGSPVTNCHFTLARAGHPAVSIPCREQVGGGSRPVQVSARPSHLNPGTRYKVRLTVRTTQGSRTGGLISFRTAAS
ncbi:MAG: hypothetical protein ACJ764_06580 [Solirubrobacteraceae bacterium]